MIKDFILELLEDFYFHRLAKKYDTPNAKRYSHDEVWADLKPNDSPTTD